MGQDNIRLFLNQHCRFKLRSGKEVFGVIWRVDSNGSEQYVFASQSEHQVYLDTRDPEGIKNKLLVDLEDIVLAERLVG